METTLTVIFIVGYAAIASESFIGINKAASALITAVALWSVYMLGNAAQADAVTARLTAHVGEFSGILFFLMAAMTIVELIDAHRGFEVITGHIGVTGKRSLLWIITGLTFFLSAVLDNLTTAIVMTSLTAKLIDDGKDRLFYIGMIVIAANAGGAWSPIGDVTTTMLWIGNRITGNHLVAKLFLPSLVSCLAPLLALTWRLKGRIQSRPMEDTREVAASLTQRNIVFFFGILSLLSVPVFKAWTHLPPYMGILLGLGILWAITERLHVLEKGNGLGAISAVGALQRIDLPSILFFLGILSCVAALQSASVLSGWATWLDKTVHSETIIVLCIGLLSAIVDNVPLVAGAMNMYGLASYHVNHDFWIFLSYCAGTGGSALIIGSAAGVAAMGMAKIDFLWYVRNISGLAVLGYAAGACVYLLMR